MQFLFVSKSFGCSIKGAKKLERTRTSTSFLKILDDQNIDLMNSLNESKSGFDEIEADHFNSNQIEPVRLSTTNNNFKIYLESINFAKDKIQFYLNSTMNSISNTTYNTTFESKNILINILTFN